MANRRGVGADVFTRKGAPSLQDLTDGMLEDGPSNALAVVGDGTIQVGAFTFTATGLVVNGQTTLGEWESVGGVLRRLDASIQWLIGDWINYGERQWGKTYEQVAEATGYEVTALRNFAYVANHVDSSLRSDELSFGHHQLVAPMEPELQQQWLDYAVANELSISQMRDAINSKSPTLSSGRPLLDKVNKRRFGKIWRNLERNKPISLDDIHAMRKWLDEVEQQAKG